MKLKKTYLLLLLFGCYCFAQEKAANAFHLTISPIVDQTKSLNLEIIATLESFLNSKNNSLTENKYWLKTDFEKYIFPYIDIYNIEKSKLGNDFYKPTLMEIIDTGDENSKILKIAFIGHHAEKNENLLKAIYNVIATKSNHEIILSRYLNLIYKEWFDLKIGKINYKISPKKSPNYDEIEKQKLDLKSICEFFNTEELEITYFSCVNPKEVFEIKGFDYNPLMYVDKTGGLADYGNIIFSGNNSEFYSHEIIHIYTSKLFPNKNNFLDEGIAMYLAGSGKYDFHWHKMKMKAFLEKNPKLDLSAYFDIYSRSYIENETSIPYMIAALICEKTITKYGKEKFFEFLNSQEDIWTILNKIRLTKENLNSELRK
jgi:hypothetical protein